MREMTHCNFLVRLLFMTVKARDFLNWFSIFRYFSESIQKKGFFTLKKYIGIGFRNELKMWVWCSVNCCQQKQVIVSKNFALILNSEPSLSDD